MRRKIALLTLAAAVFSFGAIGCGGGTKPIKSVDANNNVRPPTASGNKKGDNASNMAAPAVFK